jgi:predicted AAA+ superfamily ATPase
MSIVRTITSTLQGYLKDQKAIILLGARQVGKTTLMESLSESCQKPILWFHGDDLQTRELLSNTNAINLKSIIGQARTIIIDEAQRIENIGLTLKLIVDQIKTVKILASGSSAFELANKINEPLTGRKWEFQLFPLSFSEMATHHGLLEEVKLLPHRLVYGYYPEVVVNAGLEQQVLKQLSDSYLYKDILSWERIQKPDKLEKLLQSLAFQIGNDVSYNELGQMCGLDSQTVEKYILLLEQAFIVFRLSCLSRNLRNELKKSRKIYFYDNGLRNAIINQFNPITLRNDQGALWENFMISERKKQNHYAQRYVNTYFWRTKQQQEIDYIEEGNGDIRAFEFKWGTTKKIKFPSSFIESYQPVSAEVITPENFYTWLH